MKRQLGSLCVTLKAKWVLSVSLVLVGSILMSNTNAQPNRSSKVKRGTKDIIYPNPVVEAVNSDVNLHVDAVILTDSGTSLQLTAKYIPGHSLNVPKETYLSFEGAGSNKGADSSKYFVSSTAGVDIGNKNQMPATGVLQYTLNFPLRLNNKAISRKGLNLHFGEDLPDGKQVYGIDYLWQDRPMAKELIGRWYNKATGQLAYVILPGVVITADGKIDSITGGNVKKGVLNVVSKEGRQESLYYSLNGSELRVAGSKAELKGDDSPLYIQDQSKCKSLASKDSYKGLQYTSDTSTIKGYINAYSSLGKGNTLQFYVSDPVLGAQVNYMAEIQPDGSFEVKIPVYGPIQPMVRSDYYNGSWYLEPGKTLFALLGAGDVAYLGPLSKLNEDMDLLDREIRVSDDVFLKGIGVVPPMQLQRAMLEQGDALYKKLDSIYLSGSISTKAYEQNKLMTKYNLATDLLSYGVNFDYYYRKNNKLSADQDVPDYELPVAYFSFLTPDLMDNPDILQFSNGFFFVNYLKFLKIFRSLGLSAAFKNIDKNLSQKGVSYSKEEKEVVAGLGKKMDGLDSLQKIRQNELVQHYFDHYGWEAIQEGVKHGRDSVMASYGLKSGFMSELMYLEDFSYKVWEELTPVDTGTIRRMRMEVKDPFLSSQMGLINDRTLARIEQNKGKSGYFVRSGADIKADAIFDSIIAPYKGDVLYIDFWATWCAPCRQAIEDIKPVKQDLTAKPVKFIYITNETSPLKTWNNFIPNIKGEHFRLNNDQWTYLCKKFNISGIPHVVLVDQAGKVIDPHYAFFGQDIKAKIEGLL